MSSHTHPVDVLTDDLLKVYRTSTARLDGIVRDGLRKGLDPSRIGNPDQRVGDATLAYRKRQRDSARSIIDGLERQAGALAPVVVGRGYGTGLVTVDRIVGPSSPRGESIRGRFGTVHTRAVEALAANMSASLSAAAQRARSNVATVFDLADELDGPLPSAGRIAGVPFLGRRFNDAYRKAALETTAGGIIGLDTRRQRSELLIRLLVDEGTTTATAGFIDRAGRRWPLPVYAEMVARTTTREATTAATVNRLGEHGLDLVKVSRHVHAADECSPYEGNIYSLSGLDDRYPVLDVRPPFHPRCVHVLGPAGVNLDDFEAELAAAAAERNQPAPPTAPPAPPQTPRTSPSPQRPPNPPSAPAQAVTRNVADAPPATRPSLEAGANAVLGPHGIELDEFTVAPTSKRGHRAEGGRLRDGRLSIKVSPVVGKSPAAALKDAVEQRRRFTAQRDKRIAGYERALADDPRNAANVGNRLEEARATVRYTTFTDERVDPLRTITAHEAAHVVDAFYGRDEWRRLWDNATAGIPRIDRLRVSEYAASNTVELWAEVAAALDAGLDVPDRLRAAYLAVNRELRVDGPRPDPAAAATRALEPVAPNVTKLLEPKTPAAPPFGADYRPTADAGTEAHLEAQRVRALIDRDPGPDLTDRMDDYYDTLEDGSLARGLVDAARDGPVGRDLGFGRRAAPFAGKLNLTADELAAAGITNAAELKAARALARDAVGPDVWEVITKRAYALEEELVEDLLVGRITQDDVIEFLVRRENDLEERRAMREGEARFGGFERRQIPCFECGRLKRRPSSVCDHCGDDPTVLVDYSAGGDEESLRKARAEFDRSYGYAGFGDEDRETERGRSDSRRQQRRGG